jgi:hypothetical protein
MTGPTPTRGAKSEWTEVVATVLLALAAVATAWSSYQASKWNGEQAKAAGRTNALRIEAARASGLASSQTEVDIATFIQWVDATAHDDRRLEQFYVDRFRDEFRPAFDAWLATDPLTDPDAPPTPFAMDEYRLQATADAERLDAESERMSAVVRANIERSTNYVLGVVMFAVALFFAGMSTKFSKAGARKALVIAGCVVFIGAATWIATFPVSLSL